ncbi:MAG: hypothetical protein K2O40_06245 [Lachnospiraceae bacterium]|nr:hypothetical protein [Lachnospiraceae bacterium]
MAERTLAYFMREAAKKQEIVEVPGIESIKDENGQVVPFKIKMLTKKEIDDIYDKYRTRTMLCDKKGKPVFNRGQAVFDINTDSNRALRRIMVEALVYPDLHNKELMDFFDCYDFSEMPLKVFPNPKEYDKVANIVLSALGILEEENDDSESEVQEAKN